MSKFKEYTEQELESHFKNFLVEHWSYSSVSTFSRNEKAFEMQQIYRQRGRSVASAVAGQAYHAALDRFFIAMKEGKTLDVVILEKLAFRFIDEFPRNWWQVQATTPTIEMCIEKSNKVVTQLLNNFVSEISTYTDEIEEVLSTEEKFNEWITVNGVDIPLPCKGVLDLRVRLKNGKIVIIDHKSKAQFTNEKDIKLTGGKQAISYALACESKHSKKVDEFWFIENKYSKNRDGEPQLSKFVISLDSDTRKLYEALLYEPLRRVCQAVSDPDYVYVINDNDSFTDKAELFDFWAQTMTSEIDSLNYDPNKKELIQKRHRKVRDSSLSNVSPTIIKKFKEKAASFINYDLSDKDMTKAEKIEHVLRMFGKTSRVEHEFSGYSSDTFLLNTSAGVSIPSINKHSLDIANALGVSNVRIGKSLHVYEGKSYLAIEASKEREEFLEFDESIETNGKIPIGIDNFGDVIKWDTNNPSTPHMLICGATGSGKSVSIISTIEYAIKDGVSDIVIFDPKFEFVNLYKNRPNIRIFSDIDLIESQMRAMVKDMQKRVKEGVNYRTLVVFDEFADAVANQAKGAKLKIYENQITGYTKEGVAKTKHVHVDTLLSLEENLQVLLQKGRSCGFRVIAATQRASTKVIKGDTKVNLPVQLCFRVPKETDSRVVIDEAGAETLAGKGDGLFKSPDYEKVVRMQAYWKKQN